MTYSSQQAATTIYYDDFSGTSADLNGTTPEKGGANWVASSNSNADGSTENRLGSGIDGGTDRGNITTQLTPITAEIDMRIVLDTMAGIDPNTWTKTWSVKRAADISYTVVLATENLQAGSGAIPTVLA